MKLLNISLFHHESLKSLIFSEWLCISKHTKIYNDKNSLKKVKFNCTKTSNCQCQFWVLFSDNLNPKYFHATYNKMTVNIVSCVSHLFNFVHKSLSKKQHFTHFYGDKPIMLRKYGIKTSQKSFDAKSVIPCNNFWTLNVHLLHPFELFYMLVIISIVFNDSNCCRIELTENDSYLSIIWKYKLIRL